MLEISVHRNSKKIIDYKKNNSKKLYGMAGLLAIPTSQEIQKMLDNADRVTIEYNNSMKSFEESIKGCESSINEVNKLLDKCECMIDKTPTPKSIDVSSTGRFKDWLAGNTNEVPKISDLKGVNVDWIDGQIQQDIPKNGMERMSNNLEKLLEKMDKVDKFCGDVKWCIQNPAHTSYIIINWCVRYGTWAVIIYISIQLLLLAYTSGRVDTEVTAKIKNRISITIVIYIAILILNLILKLYLGL